MVSDHIIRGRNSDSRAHLKERQMTFVFWGVGGGGGVMDFFSGGGGQDCYFLGVLGRLLASTQFGSGLLVPCASSI